MRFSDGVVDIFVGPSPTGPLVQGYFSVATEIFDDSGRVCCCLSHHSTGLPPLLIIVVISLILWNI